MANVFGRLAIITILVVAGGALWYGRVHDRLQTKTPNLKVETAPSPVQKSGEPVPADTDYGIILSRNIFKAALELGEPRSSVDSQVEVEDLEETTMQLTLLGTVSGSKDDSRAIIRDEKAKVEALYHVGSELHGAIITRIGRGKVVLQVNGREEVLNIKDSGNSRPRQVASPPAEIPQAGVQTNPVAGRQIPVVSPQRRISFRNTTSSGTEAAAPLPEDPPVEDPVPEDIPVEETPVPENSVEDTAEPQNAQ